MRQVLLYDPTRVPRSGWHWFVRGKYAVFLSDVESSAPLTADGLPVNSAAEYFCLLFDSLADAETYSREHVKKIRRLKCEVFDSAGRTNPPVSVFVNDEFAHTLDSEAKGSAWFAGDLWRSPFPCRCSGMRGRNDAGVVWWPVLASINLVFAGLRPDSSGDMA